MKTKSIFTATILFIALFFIQTQASASSSCIDALAKAKILAGEIKLLCPTASYDLDFGKLRTDFQTKDIRDKCLAHKHKTPPCDKNIGNYYKDVSSVCLPWKSAEKEAFAKCDSSITVASTSIRHTMCTPENPAELSQFTTDKLKILNSLRDDSDKYQIWYASHLKDIQEIMQVCEGHKMSPLLQDHELSN